MVLHKNIMEHYSAIKKKEVLPLGTTGMDLKCIMLSELISQMEKDKYHMILLTCGVLKKKKKQNKIKMNSLRSD